MKDLEMLNRSYEEVYRRLRRLEMASQRGEMPREPIGSPERSFFWHDVEGGKIKVWNGKGWDNFSRDV